jgi:hypothetical protein
MVMVNDVELKLKKEVLAFHNSPLQYSQAITKESTKISGRPFYGKSLYSAYHVVIVLLYYILQQP